MSGTSKFGLWILLIVAIFVSITSLGSLIASLILATLGTILFFDGEW